MKGGDQMPKIKLSLYEESAKFLVRSIKIGMVRKDWLPKDLHKHKIINKSTMYLHMREPEQFNYSELFKLFNVLGVTDDEILRAFGRGGTS